MGGSFFIGLSGLTASSVGIKTVGNNLANANTVGYKANNAFFQELLFAGISEMQAGQGVIPSRIQQVWSQGNIQQSQVATDMAVQGAGFFVVGDGVNSEFYTRAGNFVLDSEGYLVTGGGMYVMGYPAKDGTIDQNSSLTKLNISLGQVLPPKSTQLVRFVTNLASGTPVCPANPTTEEVNASSFSTSVTVYDSLGESHIVTARFIKTAPDQWTYVMSLPPSDVDTDIYPDGVIAVGTMTFGSDGTLSSVDPDASWTSPGGVTYQPGNGTVSDNQPSDVFGIEISDLKNGASTITFDWDIVDLASGKVFLSQFNLPSATSETYQNGNSAGALTSVIVRKNGVIEGLFSNGETSQLGQVVLANFTNPQGLVKAGNNLYARTTDSGEPTIGAAGTGGRGEIHGNALEMSNVEIAEEFIKLIIFQRGFQANSRVVMTADEITQEAIALKR
jgi:flagellar hook protein FlgE